MHKSLFSSMMILGIFASTLLDRLAWKKKKLMISSVKKKIVLLRVMIIWNRLDSSKEQKPGPSGIN